MSLTKNASSNLSVLTSTPKLTNIALKSNFVNIFNKQDYSLPKSNNVVQQDFNRKVKRLDRLSVMAQKLLDNKAEYF